MDFVYSRQGQEEDMTVINGTNGMETLTGTPEGEEINGLRSNDVLMSSAGAGKLDGGAGFDTVAYSLSSAAINIDLAAA
jgi:Ca2+-binding RTX toxin-like protein